jgi:hypothetical protein
MRICSVFHIASLKPWTVEGRIRYIRAGDKNRRVYKVKSVYDPVASILATSLSS